MSSSVKNVGLTILRSTNFQTKASSNLITAASTKSLYLSNIFITRNYQKTSSTDLSKRKAKTQDQQQQHQTAVGNTSSLQLIPAKKLSYFHRYKNIMDAPEGVFKGSLDRFNGVTINSSQEYNAKDNFVEKLEKSLVYWQEQKRRAIWFQVKTEHSEWVPHLTNMNFEFHHAKNGIVVLNRWLPKDEYPNLPVYSHTMLGVGGLVVNDKDEVLVVSERYSLIPNSWKLPGGYAEPNENIVDAAKREVLEETGVECVFNTVISLRHSHGGAFGSSDMYCVVALTPKTLELRRDEREIAKLKWMPSEEYLQHPNVHETNRHFLRCYFDYKNRGIRFTCEKAQHQVLKREYCLYYIKPIDQGDGEGKGGDADKSKM